MIPSWYPSQKSKISGIFIKEQIEAISTNIDNNILVSTWGHDEFYISMKKIKNIFDLILMYNKNKNKKITKINNIYEIYNPCISSHPKIPFWLNMLKEKINESFKIASSICKIDLIHAHVSFPAGFIAFILSQKYGLPFVITEHMGPFPLPSLIKNGIPIDEIYLAISNAKRVIAVSSFLGAQIKKYINRNIDIIPNMVNENKFVLCNKLDKKKFIFLSVGNISEQKGIKDLLYAVKKWMPKNDIEFWIVGNGPEKNKFIELSKILKIDYCIKWFGEINRKNIVKLYQECDVFVLPSKYETFGIVYIEALACGKPIIATKCGGPESIINEKNGILIKIGNIIELSEALQYMFKNISKYSEHIIRKEIEEKYSREVVVKQIISLYEEVVK
jgi:glycosyltransferase involved in cell wall biosynthesis